MIKHTWKLTLWTGIMVLLVLPASTYASEEADNRVRITDPALLESKGFEPDATNVYATPEAFAQMQADSDNAATASGTGEVSASDAGQIQDHGGPHGVSTIHATDFLPVRVSGTTSYGSTGISERWCDGGLTNTYMGVFRDVPGGAELTVRRIWYYDNSAENLTADLVKICLPFFEAGEPEFTLLRTNVSSGTPGYGRFGPGNFLNEEVDENSSCIYAMRVNLGDANSCAGNQLRILKAALSWQLPAGSQVFSDRFEQ